MHIYLFGEIKEENREIDSQRIHEILHKAKELKGEVQKLTIRDIANVLNKLSTLWMDESYPHRREALAKLPSLIGFSKEMVEEGIKSMCDLLKRQNIFTRLNSDLGDYRYLDEWVYHPVFKGYMMAKPRGVVVHVSAGNVFVGGVDTLIQGIITKNVNIMKMSTVDPLFPVLFAKSLKENDDTGILHKAMALIHWKGGTETVEKPLKQLADCIVVYGGKDTVFSYRKDLGLHTKLVEYGPKYSFVVVQDSELKKRGLENVAHLIAKDALMWEQSACSSPHVVYVEGEENALRLMEAIAASFDAWAKRLPQGTVYDDEAVEINKVRELAKVEKALGKSDFRLGKKGLSTVVYQKDRQFQVSCQNRTLFIKAVDTIFEVIAAVGPMGEYMQSVAVVADEDTAKQIANRLGDMGADRFVEPGRMSVRKHGTPHDGTKGVAELVKWISLSRDSLDTKWDVIVPKHTYNPEEDYFDFLPQNERDALTLRRINQIFAYAKKHSPLLGERYEGIDKIESLEDFRKVPLLKGEDYKQYIPPFGQGLLTQENPEGIVFASGGTTGRPKVVYRTFDEQWFNALKLGKGLRLSIFDETDVVANLLFAGNMWASFVSFNMALEVVGCRILPISGNLALDAIVNALVMFGATGFITIPSVAISIAEYVEKNALDLKIKKIVTGGEHLFKEAREYIKNVLGVEKFSATDYTTNDTGTVGFQCSHLPCGFYHVHEDLHYLEILNENDEPCGIEEPGRVVVTNLYRKLMPTIRYEVGDMAKWVGAPCDCGRKTRVFELLGRSDDVLIIGGCNIYPEAVASAIAQFNFLSSHFQMTARMDKAKDSLVVIVEAKEGYQNITEGDRGKLKKAIYERSKELETMLDKGLINDIDVQIVPHNTIERNPRTGKIKLVVDNRR